MSQEEREQKAWFRTMAELALDTLPGSGLARAAFEQMRMRIRRDLEVELDALKAERERDQQTIHRLSDVLERQAEQLEKLAQEQDRLDPH